MLMLVLSCWQGQQGYNLSPRIPDEPADEWHIIANAPTVALSGKWDKGVRFARVCSMSSFIWTQVFLAVWADSKEEPKSFYRNRPPSCVLSRASFFLEDESSLCTSSKRAGMFYFFPGHNHQPCRWRDIKAVWHMLSVPGNLLALRQNDLLLWGKVNRAMKDHSQLWIRNAAFTIKKVLVSGLFHASLFYLHISYEPAMFISHILEM